MKQNTKRKTIQSDEILMNEKIKQRLIDIFGLSDHQLETVFAMLNGYFEEDFHEKYKWIEDMDLDKVNIDDMPKVKIENDIIQFRPSKTFFAINAIHEHYGRDFGYLLGLAFMMAGEKDIAKRDREFMSMLKSVKELQNFKGGN